MSQKTMLRVESLLRRLSDGKFHSGESIAEELAISRTAVWKLIQKIQSWQVEVFSVRGRGYQIPGGLALIDQLALEKKLQLHNQLFKQVIVLTSVDSTADYLAKDWKKQPDIGRVCISEHQTAGRGRKDRPWISPFAANLYFSIGVQLPLGLSALGGLSLAVGISLCRTLNKTTQNKIKIKWPNDLLVIDKVGNKKLAGILVEASGDSNDSSFLNIGVGINWDMQIKQADDIDQPWVNLKSLLGHRQLTRSEILGEILCDLDAALVEYIESGFSEFAKEWQSLSAMYQQEVKLHLPQREIKGVEIGVEANGALKLDTDNGVQVFHSGEVSLRKRY